jgi:hypothetical protein
MTQESGKVSKKALKEFLSEAEEIVEKLYKDNEMLVESLKRVVSIRMSSTPSSGVPIRSRGFQGCSGFLSSPS